MIRFERKKVSWELWDTCLWTGSRHPPAVGMKLKKTNGALLPWVHFQSYAFGDFFHSQQGQYHERTVRDGPGVTGHRPQSWRTVAEETWHWFRVQIHVLESLAWFACGKGHNTFFSPFFHIVIDLYPKATLKQIELTRFLNLRSKNKDKYLLSCLERTWLNKTTFL